MVGLDCPWSVQMELAGVGRQKDEWAGLDIQLLDWIVLGQFRWSRLVQIGRQMSGQVQIYNDWTGLPLVSVYGVGQCRQVEIWVGGSRYTMVGLDCPWSVQMELAGVDRQKDELAGLDIQWSDWIAHGQFRWSWLVQVDRKMSGQVQIYNGWIGLFLVSVDGVGWCRQVDR